MDLMYKNDYVGVYDGADLDVRNITEETKVFFPNLGITPRKYLRAFIEDRIISRSRRDIDTFLHNINLMSYDIEEIAKKTRLINPMDNFWLRDSQEETFETYVIPVLIDLFKYSKLATENTLSSGGQNIKYYSKHEGKFGIVKKRLTGLTYDTEAELASYYLTKIFNVPACPVYRIDKDNTFSEFQYDFLRENIIHMRHLVSNEGSNYYDVVINALPHLKESLINMILFDYITYQIDRHLSNFAVKGNELYPLYDNGRSLFWDTPLEDISIAISNPRTYSSTFGGQGTYYNILLDISESGLLLSNFINLNVDVEEIKLAFRTAGFKEQERIDLTVDWILASISEIKRLDNLAKNSSDRTQLGASNIFGDKN